jgi:hypothetical protein
MDKRKLKENVKRNGKPVEDIVQCHVGNKCRENVPHKNCK